MNVRVKKWVGIAQSAKININSLRQLIYSKMSSTNFAANISMMYAHEPKLSSRYMLAKADNFKFVECGFPYVEPLETVAAAKKQSGLVQTLINAWPGDVPKGELGIAALPNKRAEFKEKLEVSINYAKALDCHMMHIMAGLKSEGCDEKEMEKNYLENLKYAAERLQKEGILALIEPINNRRSIPQYFLTDIHKAVEYIEKINHPNLKLQYDFYHIQIMDGNLTKNFEQYFSKIGHVQIAQVPERGEPDTDGEINYPYVLQLLKDMNYKGYIGLEYIPKGDTHDGLAWISKFDLSL